MKNKIRIAGLMGLLAVGLGAFGAHGLRDLISSEQLIVYKTGVNYHLIHTLVLLSIALYLNVHPNKRLRMAFWFLLAGILLFSGSLYLLSTGSVLGMTSLKWLGPITPLGGVGFIVGWALITFSGLDTTKKSEPF